MYDFRSEGKIGEILLILLILLHLLDLDKFLFPLNPLNVLVVEGFVVETVILSSHFSSDIGTECAL